MNRPNGGGIESRSRQQTSSPRTIPRLPSKLVARPALVERLEAETPLVVVRGPVGSGKTTLVAQWLHARPGQRAIWITVDDDSSGAPGFWQTLLDGATDARMADPDPEHGSGSAEHAERTPRARVRRILAAQRAPVVLVVDGYDRMTDERLESGLLDLVRMCPALRLVVCLHGERHFRPHAYLDLDFATISSRDLLLNRRETSELFSCFGGTPSVNRIDAVHRDLGGWVEPIRTLAIALGASSSLADDDAAGRVAGSYLHDRLLPLLGLDRPAVGRPDSEQQGLEGLGAAFTRSLDDATDPGAYQELYYLPPAIRRALRAEFHRRHPDRAREEHARLAAVHVAACRPGPALGHAVEAEDWPLVVRVVERFWRVLLPYHSELLYRALSEAPLDAVETSVRALAVRDLGLQAPDDRILIGLPDLPADEDRLRKLGESEHVADLLDTILALILVFRRRGLFERAREYCQRMETVAIASRARRTSDVVTLLPGLWAQAGITRMLADEMPSSRRRLQRAYEAAAGKEVPHLERDASSKLALAAAVAGSSESAETWLSRCERAPVLSGWFRRWSDSTAAAARSLLAIDRLDLDEARRTIDAVVEDLGTEEFWAFVAYPRALLALHGGDALGGLHLLREACAAYAGWHRPGSTSRPLLAGIEAELLLCLGQANHARAVVSGSDREHPYLAVPRARLELLAGNPAAARSLASDLAGRPGTEPRGRLDLLVIQAQAQLRLGEPDGAADSLQQALNGAEPTGTLRPFTALNPDERTTFEGLVTDRSRALLTAGALREAPVAFSRPVELLQLTDRERELLRHLARGLPLKEVAETLYVSVNTVKSHRRTLYHKLGAQNREEAVSRARQLALLPG